MIKSVFLKFVGVITALCVFLSGSALAAAFNGVDGYDTSIGPSLELSRGVHWTGSDYRTENYIEYTPSEQTYPIIASGSRLCGTSSFRTAAQVVEDTGRHVVAGINGDYFVMANGEPLGIVVKEGELLSSDAGNYALGFNKGGKAVFGKPSLAIKADFSGAELPITAINKTRRAGEAVLFTSNFGSKTAQKDEGISIICIMEGELTLNGSVSLTVEEVFGKACIAEESTETPETPEETVPEDENAHMTGPVDIPAGKVVLSISKTAGEQLLSAAGALAPGNGIVVTVSSPDEWSDVTYAVGSLYKLITEGKVVDGLPAGAAPRTAVGMKDDGTLVFYTMDGRQPGYSVGVSMSQLAARMLELGCVEATIMDGGGSTSMNAIYLGESSLSQINKPSGGYQRPVSNYIMLVTDRKPTGQADQLAVYPLSTHILSGASAKFSVKAADANGYASSVPSGVALTTDSELGSVTADGLFTASGEGNGTVSASADGMIGASAVVTVVKTPDIIRVFHEGKSTPVNSLQVMTGSRTELMAQAMHNYAYLISRDTCFKWTVSGGVGTIDENGNFTAGDTEAEGAIMISAGDKTVTIPVTVKNPEPYDDVGSGNWYYKAVRYVTDKNLMTGTGVREFCPELQMNRAMAVTVLYRLSGSPQISGSSSFPDVEAGQWYTDAVIWATEKGIVEGYDGIFDPFGTLTREQLATVLHRYYGSPVSGQSLDKFSDSDTISQWARDAMCWSVEKGYISGMTEDMISPASSANRAQLATILMRLHSSAGN